MGLRADEVYALLSAKIASVGGGGSGGTTNYTSLTNKPKINGVTLEGNKTLEDIGIDTPTGNIDFSTYFL